MKKIIVMCMLLQGIQATVIVGPDNNKGQSFNQTITAKAYDRANGDLYIGLSQGGGEYAICVAQRSIFGSTSTFLPLVQPNQLNVNNAAILFLTLATYPGNIYPIIGAVAQPTGAAYNPKYIFGSDSYGLLTTQSNELLDGSGGPNIDGLPTNGIVGLAASRNVMFAAVMPCGGNFGADCNGGIASVAITQTSSSLALSQVPAIQGDSGIKAQIIDPTTPQVLINNSPSIKSNTVDLYWDEPLQRLYIGLQVTSAGTSAQGITCVTGTGTCSTAPLFTCPYGWQPNYVLGKCVTCPSGGYFDPSTQSCLQCPTGQTFDATLLKCVTAQCGSGTFWNSNLAACVTCPTGYYFDVNNQACAVCPNGGIYIDGIGCTACPPGEYFVPSLGICTAPISCPTGFCWAPPAGQCIPVLNCPYGYTFNCNTITCVAEQVVGPQPPEPPIIIATPTNTFRSHFHETSAVPWAGPSGMQEPEKQTNLPNMATRANPTTASGARSVITASVSTNGAITLNAIAPDSAFISGSGNLNYMVGVFDAAPQNLSINKVRTLHASTGPSYMIINGGNGDISLVGNQVYALPLVDLGDPSNPVQGTIAKKDSTLVNYKFVVPATTNTDLPLSTDAAVMVGAGPLAVTPSTAISDIEVIGDTVYVSISGGTNGLNNGGILYSQAQFDETGKIVRWTPWTKKAFPPYATPSSTGNTGVNFFAVDALGAKVSAINNTANKGTVVQTAWINETKDPTSLLYQLNLAIRGTTTPDCASTTSCVSSTVLDLDQSTRGFTANASRYALFSGTGTVIFAQISQALGNSVLSPQSVITNFSTPANFLVTTLPTGACQATTLEYARQLTGNTTNYFFAGTLTGLYVFNVNGAGFDVSSLGALNSAPFTTGSWQLAPTITGAVIDIKTTGNVLYVLMQTSPGQSTLYLIPFQPSISSMFNPANIFTIAQTGVGIFNSVLLFNSIQIISTASDGSTEQVILGTNNGLFQSTKATGVQQATNQTDAAWALISNTTSFYTRIAAIDNAGIPVSPPATVWPFYMADQNGFSTYNRTILQQLNGSQNNVPFAFVPPFDDSATAGIDPNFSTFPLFSYFWSDGARRIFTVDNIQSSCLPEQLLSVPFNTIEWNVNSPGRAFLIDPIFSELNAFYWVKQIGVSGLLMVGTDKGIIALG